MVAAKQAESAIKFVGWYRPHRRQAWNQVVEADSYAAALDALLNEPPGDKAVLPVGRNPNQGESKPCIATSKRLPAASSADTFAGVIEAAGLPDPVREHRFAPPRRWRFDFAWPAHRLALEIEGGTWSGGRHVRGKGYENDCIKYSHAALMGWKVLRVTTPMVRDGRALALLHQAFEAAMNNAPACR